jgi:tetratricopeptide (TPR) repeat protein
MGAVQLFIGVAVYAGTTFFKELPYWFLLLQKSTFGTPNVSVLPLFATSAAVILPPALFLGAMFPLVIKFCTRDIRRVGRSVGSVAALNTIGAIVGSFAGAFVLLPALGVMNAFAFGMTLNLVVAIVLVVSSSARGSFKKIALAASILALVNVFAFRPAFDSVGRVGVGSYGYLLAAGEGVLDRSQLRRWLAAPTLQVLAHEDGIEVGVTVVETADGHRSLLANGRAEGSTSSDMPTQVLAAGVPLAIAPTNKDVLIVGFATGTTVGSALNFPVSHVVTAELEPAMIEFSRFFRPVNGNPLDEVGRRLTLELNDARNLLLVDPRRYDVIISEPSNIFVSGITNLFSKDFYQLAKSRLKQNGLFSQWVQGYLASADLLRTILRTFDDSFDSVYVFQLGTFDYFLVGASGPLWVDADEIEKRISLPAVREDLRRVGIDSASELMATFLLGPDQVKEFVAEGPQIINTDDNLYLELEAPRDYWMQGQGAANLAAILALSPGEYPHIKYPGGDEQRAEWLLDAAEWRSRRGHLGLAGRIAERALSLGFNARAHGLIATLQLRRGNVETALDQWDLILAARPDHVPTLLNYAEYTAATGDLDGALPLARRVLDMEPGNPLAHFYVGLDFYRRGNMSEAAANFEIAAADEQVLKTRPEVLYNLALTEMAPAVARYESAKDHLERHLQLSPGDATAWYHLGAAQYYTDAFDQALPTWQRAASIADQQAKEQRRQAATFWQNGDLVAAAATYKRAIKLFGADATAHRELAQIVSRLGDAKEIVGAAQAAVEAFPDDSKAYLQLAAAYERNGQSAKALENYRNAADLETNAAASAQIEKSIQALEKQFPELNAPGSTPSPEETPPVDQPPPNAREETSEVAALLEKAGAGLDEGDALSAGRHARSAIELDPQNPRAHFYAGVALFFQDKIAEAALELEKAASDQAFVAEQPALLHYLALSYLDKSLGKYSEAVPLLRKHIEKLPGHEPAHYHLGAALYFSGKLDAAIRAWERGYLLSVSHSMDLLQRARSALTIGDGRSAEVLLNASMQAFRFNGAALLELATLRSAAGDHLGSVDALNQVVQISPSDKRVYYNLAQEYQAIGDIESAILNYKRYAVLERDPRAARDAGDKLAELRAKLPSQPFQVKDPWEGIPGGPAVGLQDGYGWD